MRLVIQTVEKAELSVDHTIKATISHGAIVYVGFSELDTEATMQSLIDKLVHLRIYPDEIGKTNLSIQAIEGSILFVPNFTLYADVSGSRRPSFSNALSPHLAESLFSKLLDYAKSVYPNIYHGVFGAHMHIDVTHHGPFTMVLEA
jgi:D-aminoacyl-tRNA deacylase